ncbi:MAG: CinA family protein [Candidatus Omnitrophota bacterium]|jgi:PncC family amidohydrolase|nr:MAG: CinA family protein [Candidatus Omnitrophota bacterium]
MTGKLHTILIRKHITVAAAESCTAGLFSYLLTSTPGSSRYFTMSVVSYSNESKSKLLHVAPSLLKEKGAVSEEVALRMARTIRKIARADYGIAITGIAGPQGATFGKPVGTVYIAIARRSAADCQLFHFRGSRSAIRTRAAKKALQLLLKSILKKSHL